MITIVKNKINFQPFGMIFFSSLLIGLIGQIAIPLPFTPIPVSFRAPLILLLSLLLGSRGALFATVLFLIQGAIGLPVFAGGTAMLIGPNGGFILGYLFGALVTGSIYEKTGKAILAILCGTLVIYLCGWALFSTYVGASKAFFLGVLPFIGIDCIKNVIVFTLWKLLKQR